MLNSPSRFQDAIFNFVRAGDGDAVVRATAGSGKTTTLKHVATMLPEHLRVCFLAFNNNTREELEAKLPRRVKVRTFHQIGREALKAFATCLLYTSPSPRDRG